MVNQKIYPKSDKIASKLTKTKSIEKYVEEYESMKKKELHEIDNYTSKITKELVVFSIIFREAMYLIFNLFFYSKFAFKESLIPSKNIMILFNYIGHMRLNIVMPYFFFIVTVLSFFLRNIFSIHRTFRYQRVRTISLCCFCIVSFLSVPILCYVDTHDSSYIKVVISTIVIAFTNFYSSRIFSKWIFKRYFA